MKTLLTEEQLRQGDRSPGRRNPPALSPAPADDRRRADRQRHVHGRPGPAAGQPPARRADPGPQPPPGGTRPGPLVIDLDLLSSDVRGRDVLLVDDIFHTGNTLWELLPQIDELDPASVRTAVLLRKTGQSQVPIQAGLRRLRHPRRLRRRLRHGLPRPLPQSALPGRLGSGRDEGGAGPVKPLRVAIVTRRFWPLLGGPEKVLANLAAELPARGIHATILTARWQSRLAGGTPLSRRAGRAPVAPAARPLEHAGRTCGRWPLAALADGSLRPGLRLAASPGGLRGARRRAGRAGGPARRFRWDAAAIASGKSTPPAAGASSGSCMAAAGFGGADPGRPAGVAGRRLSPPRASPIFADGVPIPPPRTPAGPGRRPRRCGPKPIRPCNLPEHALLAVALGDPAGGPRSWTACWRPGGRLPAQLPRGRLWLVGPAADRPPSSSRSSGGNWPAGSWRPAPSTRSTNSWRPPTCCWCRRRRAPTWRCWRPWPPDCPSWPPTPPTIAPCWPTSRRACWWRGRRGRPVGRRRTALPRARSWPPACGRAARARAAGRVLSCQHGRPARNMVPAIMHRPRILHIIPSLDRAGAEKQMTLLAAGLPRAAIRRPRLRAWSGADPARPNFKRAGVPVTVIGKRWRADPQAFWRLTQPRRPPAGPTWSTPGSSPPMPTAYAAARACGVRRVIAGQRCVDPWKGWTELAVDRYVARHCDCVVANSGGVRDFYVGCGLPAERIRVIPNGVAPPVRPRPRRGQLLAELGLPEHEPAGRPGRALVAAEAGERRHLGGRPAEGDPRRRPPPGLRRRPAPRPPASASASKW